MRYERLSDIARLAIRLQGMRGGMTIADIQQEFGVSRRTAERFRNAVEEAFGPLETVAGEGRQVRWRLRSPSLRQLVRVSDDELAELNLAAESLERAGLAERAEALEELATKPRTSRCQRTGSAPPSGRSCCRWAEPGRPWDPNPNAFNGCAGAPHPQHTARHV